MSQHYSNPERADEAHALPDVEVFYHAHGCVDGRMVPRCEDPCCAPDEECGGPGWYYWSCFPGCLPDSEPCGPFNTEAEAVEDAQANSDDYSHASPINDDDNDGGNQ